MSPSLSFLTAYFFSGSVPQSPVSWLPFTGPECPALFVLEGGWFPTAPTTLPGHSCSQSSTVGGRGGSVPSCSWEKTGQKGTDSGWKQSSLKSRALGREHRQWHLLSCQEFLGSAKFLPTLLTPFMRMEPGLGS